MILIVLRNLSFVYFDSKPKKSDSEALADNGNGKKPFHVNIKLIYNINKQ